MVFYDRDLSQIVYRVFQFCFKLQFCLVKALHAFEMWAESHTGFSGQPALQLLINSEARDCLRCFGQTLLEGYSR